MAGKVRERQSAKGPRTPVWSSGVAEREAALETKAKPKPGGYTRQVAEARVPGKG